jgi:ankyrin repeat protein
MLTITDDDFLQLENYCKTCIDDKQLTSGVKIPNLIFKSNINWSTLLDMAVKHDNYRFIDYLLNNGHDINFRINGYNPVMYTIWAGKSRTLVFLIKRGSHILSSIHNTNSLYNPVGHTLIIYGVDISINRYTIDNEFLMTYSPEL